LSKARNVICGVMIFVLPASLTAQDPGRAMLRSQGGTWLNGSPSPESSAIFPDDLIQTEPGHVAKINADGSTVTVQPETILQFRGSEIVLDHGSLLVDTSRGMKVRVNCLTVIPVIQQWTQYDVTDVNGKVTVVAHKNDVNIHSQSALAHKSKQTGASGDMTVREGETANRDEHCPATGRLPGSIDANGAWMDSWGAKGIGAGAIGVIVCKALCFHGDDPVSPSKP
jgi:hypothetical protein